LWDAQAQGGGRLTTLEGHEHVVNCVSWSPDGRTIASGDSSGTVLLWDAETWEPIGTLEGHPEGLLGLAWSPDGSTLAVPGPENSVLLFGVETPTQR
jgi:WD40 repeat protein